jgi:hypothetical protein
MKTGLEAIACERLGEHGLVGEELRDHTHEPNYEITLSFALLVGGHSAVLSSLHHFQFAPQIIRWPWCVLVARVYAQYGDNVTMHCLEPVFSSE